jgi:hypothetical protein
MNFQIGTVLVLITLISISSGYKERPSEYEGDSVRHIDYEQDQMPIKVDGKKSKRLATYAQDPEEYEYEGVQHVYEEDSLTPAQDRSWQVKPKVKRMSSSKQRGGKTVHIYLNKDDKQKSGKASKKGTTTSTIQPKKDEIETQTRKTPELTTRADHVRIVDYVDTAKSSKDSVPSESFTSKKTINTIVDSQTEPSEHQEIIKEKIKIKHHHHHHHHNHVKTVVKKEPYAVEKVNF